MSAVTRNELREYTNTIEQHTWTVVDACNELMGDVYHYLVGVDAGEDDTEPRLQGIRLGHVYKTAFDLVDLGAGVEEVSNLICAGMQLARCTCKSFE